MPELGFADWIVCLAYLAVVFGLAVASSRGQHSNEDYFVGGRRMNWLVVGISMFATSFSSISFLGLPQRGAYQDFSFYLTILFIPFVITPILWFVFVPLYVKLNVSSGYEYLGQRFGPAVQRLGSGLYCVYALGWMGTMLFAIAVTLQTIMELSDAQYYWALIGIGAFATLYTVLGGLKAVIWTDVMQAVVLGGAIVTVMLLAVARLDGGWSTFWLIAGEHDKFQLIHWKGNLLAAENFTANNSVYTAAAFGLFMYLPGYAVAQNMVQRYVCAGSLAAGRKIVLLSAAVNSVLGLLFLAVGTALFVFYTQSDGGLPQAGRELVTEDQILPYFVATQLPGLGLVGLIFAGLFAAAMSTIDSGINGVSSVIVFDWLDGRELSITFSRLLTATLGAIVILAAILAPLLGENVIDIINVIAGTSLGMLLAVYLLGIFCRRSNTIGVLAGMASGLCCLIAIMAFTELPSWWYGAFTMGTTFVIGFAASFCQSPRAISKPPQGI